MTDPLDPTTAVDPAAAVDPKVAALADARRPVSPIGGGRGVAALVLIALAVLFAVLYTIDNSREDHSYNDGATAPTYVHITVGRQYEISTPGGPDGLTARVGPSSPLNCNYSQVGGSATNQLTTTRFDSSTRTTHAVGTFVAPVTGQVRIVCRALESTFIDDADNTSADPAGFFLLMCTICLSLGAMLGLSALYRRGPRPRVANSDEPRPSEPGGSIDPTHLLASPVDG